MCFSVQIQRDLNLIAKFFDCTIDAHAFYDLKDKASAQPEFFKLPDEDNRIYPNTFAPVIISLKGQRVIRPMRYRLRPAGSSQEIPSKFNVFNARVDSLEKRQSWRPLFGCQHGIFPFLRFYEWVQSENGKKLVSFFPKSRELMWAPVLFDHFEENGLEFDSFALITKEPPVEILEAGHDRCPLFLKRENIDLWLNPRDKERKEMYAALEGLEKVIFGVTNEESQAQRKEDPQLNLFGDND